MKQEATVSHAVASTAAHTLHGMMRYAMIRMHVWYGMVWCGVVWYSARSCDYGSNRVLYVQTGSPGVIMR